MTRFRLALICLFIFAVALALRLPGLDSFLTPDENLWATRSTQFLTALSANDWAATSITGHPGVTTMWAGSLGLIAKWLLTGSSAATGFLVSVEELAANPVRLDYLPWLRMPVALACAAAIAAIYLLARRVMDERTALLGAGLLIFDPFLLAHGRLLQMDGLLTAGIAVAWLALVVALRTGQRRFYLISGLSIGAALLTKSPALVMGPLMLGAIVLTRMRQHGSTRARLGRTGADLLWTGIPAAISIFLLWPAMWADPVAAFGNVWELMTTYGGEAHELGSYWLGRPAAEPGMLFYPATLVLRMTPVTSSGLLWALGAGLLDCRTRRTRDRDHSCSTVLALLGFVLWFGVVLTLGAKRLDRYLLPIFPALDLLAAWGWTRALRQVAGRLRQGQAGLRDGGDAGRPRAAALSRVSWAGAALLVAVQAWGALAGLPSYLTTYNPLAGGIRAAARTLPVGWGEGLEEAAAYLNDLPGSGTGHAAAWYGQNVFGAFYRGASFDLYYDTPLATDLYARDVDWVVTYINQEQRGLVDSSVAARLDAPLHSVTRSGVTLASVYAWPKPFAHTGDRLVGEGLRLLGWQVGDHNRREGVLPVTLYWDAAELAAAPGQRVVIWLKDAAGEVWANAEQETGVAFQAESAAVQSGSSPVQEPSLWDGPVSAQSFTLHHPAGLNSGVYRIEIAPFAGNAVELAALEIAATRLADVASLGPDVVAPREEVHFGDIARLVGSSLERTGGSWTVELVWAWLASPEEPYHYFIHVVDDNEKIIAQQDGPLAVSGAPGELARQRVRLAMPQDMPAAHASWLPRVYVGIYRPRDGERAPLVVDGQAMPEGRYLLRTGP